MFCDRCGAKLEQTQRFCPSCGKEAGGGAPLVPRPSRLAGHIRLLGILWLAVSALRLLPGFVLTQFHRMRFPPFPPDAHFVWPLFGMIGSVMIVGAVLGLVAGWGLLDRQRWARMLAIVMGAIGLVDIPFGTALGIYTLWVLLPAESDEEYRRIAKAA